MIEIIGDLVFITSLNQWKTICNSVESHSVKCEYALVTKDGQYCGGQYSEEDEQGWISKEIYDQYS